MFKVSTSGSFKHIDKWLSENKNTNMTGLLSRYGEIGVSILEQSTPVDSGRTSKSWRYKLSRSGKGYELSWYNDNLTKMNIPVAILIQYGHATRSGGFVPGYDFINPAIDTVLSLLQQELGG